MTDTNLEKETARLANLARAQQDAEQAVAEAEEKVKERKRALRDISENQIPELMNSLGLVKYISEDGLTVIKKSNVHASITKERMPQAVAWLRANGHEQLVKHTFTVVSKDDKEAKKLEKALAKYDGASGTPKVNPMTLKAWAKEMLESGADIDMELFGVFVRDVAVVKTA